MKNYVQPGEVLTIVTPVGGLTSGQGVLIGAALFGVATMTTAAAEENEVITEGVVEIAKTSALAISIGDRLFWDATNKVVNKTAAAQLNVGVAVADAANPSATVVMKLGAYTPAGT